MFVVKSWGLLKNFKIRSGSYSGLGRLIYVKKTELKSCWTVPLTHVTVHTIFIFLEVNFNVIDLFEAFI